MGQLFLLFGAVALMAAACRSEHQNGACNRELGFALESGVSVSRAKNLRLFFPLMAGLLGVSACVTTSAVAPARVAALAALPENCEVDIQTLEGVERVNGSTRVTLHSAQDGGLRVDDARLSSFRIEGSALVLPENGGALALSTISGAEITKPAPGRSIGLFVGLVLGTVLVVAATFFFVQAITVTNVSF